MKPEMHTLSLKAHRTTGGPQPTVLYTADCSCDKWSIGPGDSQPLLITRARHMAHLQSLLGPDAQAERLDRS
jgi:hypothetical protein